MTPASHCRHVAGPGIQTVPITNCAVTLPGDVIEAVLAFHARQREPGPAMPSAGYRAESLTALFGKDTL
jgi:hypothetical protein